MGKRYMVRWDTNNWPTITLEPDGVLTYLEAKEQVVGWHVTKAEWWMGLDEEEFNRGSAV
jgi:hypothetical protein